MKECQSRFVVVCVAAEVSTAAAATTTTAAAEVGESCEVRLHKGVHFQVWLALGAMGDTSVACAVVCAEATPTAELQPMLGRMNKTLTQRKGRTPSPSRDACRMIREVQSWWGWSATTTPPSKKKLDFFVILSSNRGAPGSGTDHVFLFAGR